MRNRLCMSWLLKRCRSRLAGPVAVRGTADCHLGDCAGAARYDDCGVCAGGTSGVVPDADKDCAGVCSGLAVADECGASCARQRRRQRRP